MELSQVIERCQQGDRKAFGQLYTASEQRLRTICLHYAPDKATADDLLHDAFILIITRIKDLKEPEKAEVWMTTIMHNVARLYLREQKQHKHTPLKDADETATTTPADMTYDEIMDYIDALPEGYRRVFRLSVLEGLTHEQIAHLLHIEPHSSSSQLYRAKRLLRKWLSPMVLVLLAVVLPLGYYFMKKVPTPPQEDKPGIAKSSDISYPSVKSIAAAEEEEEYCPRPSVKSDAEKDSPRLSVKSDAEEDSPRLSVKSDAEEENPRPSVKSVAEETDSPRPSVKSDAEEDSPRPSVKSDARETFTISLAYSGISNRQDMQLPYATGETNAAVYDSLVHHNMPITVSLMLNYRLNRHWQVGAGLSYQHMTSDMRSGNSYASLDQHQRVQSLGIPVSLSCYLPLGKHLSTYLSGSVAVHFPLHSTLENSWTINGNVFDTTTERLQPGITWSTGMGLGLQYNPIPHVGFFVEPSLQYYFKNSKGVETWNTRHPIVFSLPVGLRITW